MFEFIKKVLAVIFIVAAIVLITYGLGLATGYATGALLEGVFSISSAGALAFGAGCYAVSVILDKSVANDLWNHAKDVTDKATDAAKNALSKVSDALTASPLTWALLGFGCYMIWRKHDN